MNNILLISYITGSSGQFLEHFLMKHDGIFNKGHAELTMYNEYDNMYPEDYRFVAVDDSTGGRKTTPVDVLVDNIELLKDNKFNDDRDPLRNPLFMPDESKAKETDTIIISYHELDEKYNLENKNLSILGIDITDLRSRKYVHHMELLKQCSRIDFVIELDGCSYYEDNIKCQNVPYYFINHRKFFLESDVNEYKNMCQFLNIEPKIEMYLENMNHYMYENNRLLDEYKLV